jgi:hypothetical protein
VSTLRNLCAHRLEVAIATASEKFIDRFAVVPDEDRFAVVPDEDGFAVVPDKDGFAMALEIVHFADELDSTFFAGTGLAARSGWSMDRRCGNALILTYASPGGRITYIGKNCPLVKRLANPQDSGPFAQGCVAFSIFSII